MILRLRDSDVELDLNISFQSYLLPLAHRATNRGEANGAGVGKLLGSLDMRLMKLYSHRVKTGYFSDDLRSLL